ncbi:heterokaryon incompatibility protein-domain-containing protein [Truncatella angustata]|uniref:Heterokaryon incompatibility protein-domain-containing protein n=1 Tax=Truncatella angustata TaxID=152316 RepID=A0A9P8UCR0_9PEZI|nr:heterokaryon incompatibility protein-domain-containing protein [Truncatella angustata]KAH6646986.1 heterokaryon incompatibility protein-domain-containing protein [Truncatella angustata]
MSISRWHETYCSEPDVKVVGGLPCCTYCFAVASIDDLALEQSVEKPQSLVTSEHLPWKLAWPACVEYLQSPLPENATSENSTEHLRSGELAETAVQSQLGGVRQLLPPTTAACGRQAVLGYVRLQHSDQIRLLRLSAARQGDPIHADFTDSRLNHDEPAFDALSYTWADESGDSIKRRPIFIGRYWDVYPATRNCEKALQSIRQAHGPRNVWLDAICINQDDDDERSMQVGLMSRIYASANQVLVYLGDLSTDGDVALDLLARKDLMHIFSWTPASVTSSDHIKLCQCDACAQERDALKTFFNRPYFRRLWVVQELVLAKIAWIYCGFRSIPWPVSGLKDTDEVREGPRWIQYRDTRAKFTNQHLLSLLVDTSTCCCSDPRDKVFAILGLIHSWDQEPVMPDYSRNVKEVYIGIAAYLIQICGAGRDVFSYANGQQANLHLPSWVPDWSKSGQRSGFDLHWWEAEDLPGQGPSIPTKGYPIRFKDIRTVKPYIESRSAALRVKVMILGNMSTHFKWNGDKKYWVTSISPITSRPNIYLTCPAKALTNQDHLVWLYGINTFAVLRSNDSRTEYTLMCVAELCTIRSVSSDHWDPMIIDEFSSTDQEVLQTLDKELISAIWSELQTQPALSFTTSFSDSLRRIVDAGYCMDRGTLGKESVLLEQWLRMRDELAQILNSESDLKGLMRLVRNVREESFDNPEDPSYAYNGEKLGTLSGVNRLLWSLLLQHTEQTVVERVCQPKTDSFEKIKNLKIWADMTELFINTLAQSSQIVGDSWRGLFPGATLHKDWQVKYNNFRSFLASKFGLAVKEALPIRVLTLSILELHLELQSDKSQTREEILLKMASNADNFIWDWSALQAATNARQNLWFYLQEHRNMRRWVFGDSVDDLKEDFEGLLEDEYGAEVSVTRRRSHLDEQIIARLDMRSFNLNVDNDEIISII